MEWDNDEFIRQLREFLTAHGITPDENDELDDTHLRQITNLAAKVARGDITMHEANLEIRKMVAAHFGYRDLPDTETFRLEVDFHDLVDVSQGTKDNLILCGMPGISDALVEVWADPAIIDEDDSGMSSYGVRTSDTERVGGTAIAIQSKRWFNITGMHPDEHRLLHWAISQALRDHVTTN